VVSSSLGTELEGAIRTIQRVVRAVAPQAVSGDEARGMVDLLAEGERAVSSGIALLTPRVVETGAYAKTGQATAADWLSSLTGTSAGVAKGRLAAAQRAARVPVLTEALHDGDLSTPQLKLVTDAAAVAPDALDTLLPLAGSEASHQELSAAAMQLRTAARCRESARARRTRVHVMRSFRWHQDPSGGIRGDIFCDEAKWGRVAPQLERDAKARWKAAGYEETLEAHRLDAFLHLMTTDGGGGGGGGGSARAGGSRPLTLVLVDADALRRGHANADETCEIDGIGPVSVESATELLGQGNLQFVLKEGRDIRTVTTTSRTAAQRTYAGLMARDRVCVVPGCGKYLGLEGDHCVVDFGDDGPTELDNLARLCGPHHAMKTYGGWRLSGGAGHWTWVAPANPPSAHFIARARRLAAAKATGHAKRNNPRRT
jgi:hypothetical protein